MPLGKEEIEHRFGFHKATIEGANASLPKHRDTRLKFREFAEFLDGVLPEGRAKSVAFTELENASMWSHKAIAETAPVVNEVAPGTELVHNANGDLVTPDGRVYTGPFAEAAAGTEPLVTTPPAEPIPAPAVD